MPYRTDIVIVYDGSFEGLMSAVFECYSKKLSAVDVFIDDDYIPSLFDCYRVETDLSRVKRVCDGLRTKVSADAFSLVEQCFLSARPKKEKLIIDFITLAFKEGRRVTYMLGNDVVREVTNAVRSLTAEAHQYKGFVRFIDCGEALVSIIEPKGFVLPFLAPHFCDRFHNETFMIFDKTHGAALVYKDGYREIIELHELPVAFAKSEEENYQGLWKEYCRSAAIMERVNPRCQMGHMQKRYWKHLIEMQDNLDIAIASNNIETAASN